MTHELRDHGIVLRLVPYREADVIANILTAAHGRLAVSVRGARSSRRRFGGLVEPGNLLELRLTRGRAGHWQLDEATLAAAHPGLRQDYHRWAVASCALELASAFAPEEAARTELYDLVARALEAFATSRPTALGPLWLRFQIRVLQVSGFANAFDRCAICHEPFAPGPRKLVPAAAGLTHPGCARDESGVVLSAPAAAVLADAAGPRFVRVAQLPGADPALLEALRTLPKLVAHELGRDLPGRAHLPWESGALAAAPAPAAGNHP